MHFLNIVSFREFISSIALRQQDEDADDKEKTKKKKDVEVKEEKSKNGVGLFIVKNLKHLNILEYMLY